MSTDSLYEILGVDPSVSDEQLHEAFERIERRLAGAADPVSVEDLRRAKEAFAILSSRRKRGMSLEPRALPRGESPLRSLLTHGAALESPPVRSLAELFLAAIQRPAFLAFVAALVALLIFRDIETTKNMVELQRVANEKAVAEASAARNKILEAREAELAQAQHELDEKRLELEARRIDVGQQMEAKRIEAGQQSVENLQWANARQAEAEKERIEAQKEKARQEMELAQPRIQAEANQMNAAANMMNAKARETNFPIDQAEYEINRQVRYEKALLDKYREQRLNGEDRITHSNPGLDRR